MKPNSQGVEKKVENLLKIYLKLEKNISFLDVSGTKHKTKAIQKWL